MDLIHQLDRPEPQVMISVLIAEVTLSDSVELGVEIAGQELDFSRNAILGPNGVLEGSDFDFVGGTDLGAAGLGLGGFNFTINGEDFSFLLHALQQDSRLEVLSRPILLVRNGQEGKITIADQVPYVESTQLNDTGSTNSSIGREDVGIVLTATPQISPDGYVTIKLKQELSNIAGENIQLTEGVSSPIFQTREVDTNVTVRDGETVVIGGLITSRESEAENKVPILGDLPIIGWLGRSTSVTKTKTELLMVLTVDILRTDEDRFQMSVEQRDKFVLPDSIRRSPLMEGLRVRPEESGLGPVNREPYRPGAPVPAVPPPSEKQYGPKPKTYGPTVPPPATSTTTTATYGPKIADQRGDDPS
jgi:general secretion pathway protein D